MSKKKKKGKKISELMTILDDDEDRLIDEFKKLTTRDHFAREADNFSLSENKIGQGPIQMEEKEISIHDKYGTDIKFKERKFTIDNILVRKKEDLEKIFDLLFKDKIGSK